MKPIGLAVAYTLREYRGRTRQHQKKKKKKALLCIIVIVCRLSK